jgi:5-methylcytosine-specific restriction endonuclease McrA
VRCFGGHRETVLRRDGCCQVCLARERLVVHHRRPGTEKPAWHITLCRRCHLQLHRRRQLPGVYGEVFFRLWREQHPGSPAQLRLPLAT